MICARSFSALTTTANAPRFSAAAETWCRRTSGVGALALAKVPRLERPSARGGWTADAGREYRVFEMPEEAAKGVFTRVVPEKGFLGTGSVRITLK